MTGPGAVLAAGGPAVPGEPTSLDATPGDRTIDVSWTAPPSGDDAITSYAVGVYEQGSESAVDTTTTAAGTTNASISGLTNGQAYVIAVVAKSGAGTGQAAFSAAVTPVTVPTAPTAVAATATNSQAVVTWTAPTSDGGTPITSYTVTPFVSGVAVELARSHRHGEPTGDAGNSHEPHRRDLLHLRGARYERGRSFGGVEAELRRDAPRPARCSDSGVGDRVERERQCHLDRSFLRRRDGDRVLHGDPLPGRDTSPEPRSHGVRLAARDQRPGPRPDQRRRVPVRRRRHELRRLVGAVPTQPGGDARRRPELRPGTQRPRRPRARRASPGRLQTATAPRSRLTSSRRSRPAPPSRQRQ